MVFSLFAHKHGSHFHYYNFITIISIIIIKHIML